MKTPLNLEKINWWKLDFSTYTSAGWMQPQLETIAGL